MRIFLVFLFSQVKGENQLCARHEKHHTREIQKLKKNLNNELDIIRVGASKGGMSVLAAFGETRVQIESTNSPIRVTRAAKEQDAKDINSGYMSSIVSTIFDSGSKVYSSSFSPFEPHYIHVEPQKKMFDLSEEVICYSYKLKMICLARVLPLVIGMVMFFQAKQMSRNLTFHYAGGMTAGVALAAFALIFLLVRLMPMKRSGLLSLWVGGSSVIIWAFNRFQSQALELIQAYPWAVSAYVMLAAGFSFCFCYWFESNLKTPKFQKIICWILQCIGLGLIFISSWLVTINIAIITFLLIREFVIFSKRPSVPAGVNSGAGDITMTNGSPRAKMMKTPERKSFFPAQTSTPRSNFFSPLRLFQQRAPLVSVKKYLTTEEFEEQGKRETDLGLVSLRDQINSSPEPMKLLKKLHPDTRNKIINFATGADHIDSDDSSDLDLNSQSDEEEFDSGEHSRYKLDQTYVKNRPGHQPSTPRENRSSNLRRQVLQKNTSRPIWK